MMRDSLDQAAGIDEHQGCTMLLRQFDNAGVDFLPHFVARDWPEQRGWDFDREVKGALVADIYDHRIGPSISGEKVRDIFDRLLRGREPNADRRAMSQRL